MTTRNTTNAIQFRPARTNAPNVRNAIQMIITTHPCHLTGGPQPQPYRLAGNQIPEGLLGEFFGDSICGYTLYGHSRGADNYRLGATL
jgi:hypothetical protein